MSALNGGCVQLAATVGTTSACDINSSGFTPAGPGIRATSVTIPGLLSKVSVAIPSLSRIDLRYAIAAAVLLGGLVVSKRRYVRKYSSASESTLFQSICGALCAKDEVTRANSAIIAQRSRIADFSGCIIILFTHVSAGISGNRNSRAGPRPRS